MNGQYKNFNFLVQRGGKFEEEGRIHSYEESVGKDREVEQMMRRYGLFYGVYKHETLNVIVQNVQKTHEKMSDNSNNIRQEEMPRRNTGKRR